MRKSVKIVIAVVVPITVVMVFVGIASNLEQESLITNTESNTNLGKPSQELQTSTRTISLYIDPLPFDVDRKYANSVREAIAEWEKMNPNITFRETISENADVHVQWVKEFGGHPLGQVVKKDFVQIGLGDSYCLGKWKPYNYETVLLIAKHEFGHVLGLEHSSDPNSIMYERITTKYETDLEETEIIPDGGIRFYPVCTKNSVAQYSFAVTSSEPLDIYIVPSDNDYKLLSAGKEFTHYPSCQGSETKFYRMTCSVPAGSGIILKNPTIFGLGADAQFTLIIKEL